jgi:hypothetical protein
MSGRFMVSERRLRDWKEWSESDAKRKAIEDYARATEGGMYPIDLARRLAERHARTCPDFGLIVAHDRHLLDRLVRKLPAWELADVRLMRRRRDTVERALTTVDEREALRELCERYDRVALAYGAAGFLLGWEGGKAVPR